MANPLVGPEASPFVHPIFTTLGPLSGPGRPLHVKIALSNYSVDQWAANGTAVATASVKGNYSGTPSWSITDASGAFQINSSTGAITVLDTTKIATPGTISITVSVSGTTPVVPDLIAPITVNADYGGISYQLLFAA